MSLSDTFSDESTRSSVIDDCVDLVDAEVQRKSGLGGMLIKTAYKAVKGIKPGFIRKVVSSLFDSWIAQLEPLWKEAADAGNKPSAHFENERSRVADALLKVTDDRADNAKSGVVRKFYNKLRPSAKKHVEEAVPGLTVILEKHG